jgi:bifunctional DNA-binding transcriptional regulator/antitoxin component of YhaV-PrlF toxin-antitoxin module
MTMRYEQTRRIRAISKVYQRGKTQVPSEVRKALGLEDQDRILWIIENGKWTVEKA